jgi:hypothetical protein
LFNLFSALGQALNLAKEIITHPQQCLRVDRDSAIHATYSAKNLAQALQYEGDNALTVISHVSKPTVIKIFKIIDFTI